MKYGYNNGSDEMSKLGIGGFEGGVWHFWYHVYLGFMKRKTLDKSAEKAFQLLKEMVSEMEKHAETLKKI